MFVGRTVHFNLFIHTTRIIDISWLFVSETISTLPVDDPGGVDEQIEMDSFTDEQTGVHDMDESVFDQVGFSIDSSTDEQTGVDDVEVVDESLSEHFEIPVEEEPSLLDSFMAEPDVDEDEIQFKIIDNATQRGRPLPVDSKGYK